MQAPSRQLLTWFHLTGAQLMTSLTISTRDKTYCITLELFECENIQEHREITKLALIIEGNKTFSVRNVPYQLQ